MINKPEKIIKRIIKAVGKTQGVLVIGNWQEELLDGLKEKENILQFIEGAKETSDLPDNSFTKIVCDYASIKDLGKDFYKEARRLLLPTGILIISANSVTTIFDRIMNFIFLVKPTPKDNNLTYIKPKILQDEVHENGFLMDGYYGYPGNNILMMAQIQNKEVATLFEADEQSTKKNLQTLAKRTQ